MLSKAKKRVILLHLLVLRMINRRQGFFLIGLMTLFASSCVSFSQNDEGGLRVDNPRRLKFYGKQFKLSDTTKIDTNAIYVLSNHDLPNATPFEISKSLYCRFFANGQVLFVMHDKVPLEIIVNNSKIGWQGYYKIKKDKLKVREFEIINGGQVGLRWGRFDGGDILFYSNTPKAYSYSWRMLEKHDLKKRWKKIKVDGLEPMQLGW